MRTKKYEKNSPQLERLPPVSPAGTMEEVEEQIIADAMNLVHRRILDGSASPTEINACMRLASRRSRLEETYLSKKIEVLESQLETMKVQREREGQIQEVLQKIKQYRGEDETEDYTGVVLF